MIRLKEAIAVWILLCSSFSFGNVQKIWSNDLSLPSHDRMKRDVGSYSYDLNTVIPHNASFDKVYKFDVGANTIHSFTYTEQTNLSLAVRVSVVAKNASKEFPVLFVVKEQRGVLAWQVPLMLVNIYDYYEVNRTLCPVNKNDVVEKTQTISVDVSSMSPRKIQFSLKAELIFMELPTEEDWTVVTSPSKPMYYRYSFPADVNSVVVHVQSDDDLCMVFSVQDIHCPVYDLVRNVEFSGSYQTVTKQGAITVPRSMFTEDSFFVVLVVQPNDLDCTGKSVPGNIVPAGQAKDRQKTVTLRVTPSVSVKKYYAAIFGAIGWFGLFYLAALIISIVYHFTDRTHVMDQERNDDVLPSTSLHNEASTEPGETDVLVISPQSPGGGLNPVGGSSYGAISGSNDATPQAGLSGASFQKTTNGIPHRIPPPSEGLSDDDDVSDVDENDIDMLHDIDHEKDVFRTKTFLYVSDLARKPRAVLAKKYKLYHWNLITISIFYALPVIQLVITYQTVLHMTGNEDICYYNFDCARPLGVLSSFNNVFSNVGYILLGLLFLFLVWRRDKMHQRLVAQNDRYEKFYGIPQHFGLLYAVGIALAMEGLLSGCYHVCPSYSNFQFDTSYMYMIAWLCMLKIYQTRHPDINAHAHTAYFAMSLVIFLAVVGVVYGSPLFWVLFAAIQISATLTISLQLYYMGRWHIDCGIFRRIYQLLRTDRFHCMRPMYMDRMILLVFGNAVNWSFAIFGLIEEPKDFASYLLAIFMVNLLMYFAFYIIMKLRNGERPKPLTVIYIVLATFMWGGAAYFFFSHLTSWQKTPAMSREYNAGCRIMGFYDNHDIWHFLSSMAMFLSFMVLLTLDDDLVHVPRDRIPVF